MTESNCRLASIAGKHPSRSENVQFRPVWVRTEAELVDMARNVARAALSLVLGGSMCEQTLPGYRFSHQVPPTSSFFSNIWNSMSSLNASRSLMARQCQSSTWPFGKLISPIRMPETLPELLVHNVRWLPGAPQCLPCTDDNATLLSLALLIHRTWH